MKSPNYAHHRSGADRAHEKIAEALRDHPNPAQAMDQAIEEGRFADGMLWAREVDRRRAIIDALVGRIVTRKGGDDARTA